MNFLYVILLSLLTVFWVSISINAYENECLYAWNERTEEPKQCKGGSDCKGEGSNCIFSPLSNQYICCASKKNAIQPECPKGMSLTMEGKNTEIILCDRNVSGSIEEQCPYSFECVESVLNFTKYPGQSNSVCCVH